MQAKQKGKLLLFNLRTQKFTDNDGNSVDINRKEIFPRCKIQDSEQLLSTIENNGGSSIVTRADSNICHIIQMNNFKSLFFSVGHSLLGGNMLISDNSTPVLVTDALSIIRDDYGKREWRVFVVKGKIWCVSRASDDLIEIEPYVFEKIKTKIEQISEVSIFPSSYCVDFFEYDNNGEIIFDICEFNSIECSGVFRNNNLVF